MLTLFQKYVIIILISFWLLDKLQLARKIVGNNIKDKIESISKINCKIVPNFIDCKKFDLKKNENKDNFTLINISNFYKVKALDVLLKALNIVVNEKNKKNVKLKIFWIMKSKALKIVTICGVF